MKEEIPFDFSDRDRSEWTSISLTHIEYIKGDNLGKLLALFSLLPVALGISFGTLIIFRRDLHTICFLAGLILDEGVNWVVKRIVKEPRPDFGKEVLYTEYGWPSSHSQFAWFFTTYLIVFLFIRVHHNQHFFENAWKYLTGVGSIASSCLVSYSSVYDNRVYLGYHSLNQVLWGAVIGAALGLFWFCFVHLLLTPFFPTIASWSISEKLMIRDSTRIPNVLWFEYTCHRSEARSRLRKMTSRKSL
ncbi:hypothetical protein CAPTEDRAFT_219287 [Capitella teleta]|uniref:Dolichyldiphosphatase n=1 Tax=Capitella teleta TaxID=283909 RepID=R7TWW6_CAPTE|nr:hypothetical protein CAPTEDRAFT_219287 [Capitella teleta]|eukprot:ELT95926.1 hypothetical protein CAPTEDRAFT_219287 [Capitella teleta]